MENLECMISIESLDSKESYKAEVHNDPDKNCLFYKEEDKTITTFDYENNVLTRENEKMKLVYKFILNEKTINNIDDMLSATSTTKLSTLNIPESMISDDIKNLVKPYQDSGVVKDYKEFEFGNYVTLTIRINKNN